MEYNSNVTAGKGLAAIAAAGAIGTTGLATIGCSDNRNKYDSWASTDGNAGRINLGAVVKALDDSKDPTAFEKRVNEIYEGKELVLIKIYEKNGAKTVEGWADLNNNSTLDTASDDKLFSINLDEAAGKYEVKGHGVNSHYSSSHVYHHNSGTNGLLTGILIGNMLSGPSGYVTPRSSVSSLRTHRSSYRSSPSFKTQKTKNASFTKTQKAKNPAAFKKASKSASPARRSFQSKSKPSGFKGGKSSGSRFGGSKSSGSRGGGWFGGGA